MDLFRSRGFVLGLQIQCLPLGMAQGCVGVLASFQVWVGEAFGGTGPGCESEPRASWLLLQAKALHIRHCHLCQSGVIAG